MASAAQHHGVGNECGARAIVQVEGQRAEAVSARDEELRDVLVLDHRNSELARPPSERCQDGATRPVARIASAAPAVCAEEALIDAAIGRTRERTAPFDELVDRLWSFPDYGLDDHGITE